ncbi:DUF1775 domain-containing protein [Rhabdaerophilum calidifontis]|uniref:DUF1775 domain-containing protein n=1 Tax=Rhabdaerophilum calidifontis TaxID=2604328 RepID=UPI00319E9317
MSMFTMRLAAPLSACLLALAAPQQAGAHATFEVQAAPQDSTQKMVLRIPHGCEGQATNIVRVTIPEGLIAVKPMPKSGWTLTTSKGDYARSYTLYGREVKAGVKEIVWSGGNLADDNYDEFVFQARVTDALPANETLFVPVVQECASGKVAWTEIPAKGQDPHALKMPAPGIRILPKAVAQAGGHGSHAAAPSYKVGGLVISAPWTRATPAGAKVAGGFMTITNTGSAPDRLIGGSAEIAGIFEVHEMAMDGGVMKMRALAKGLEIKPGETVTLKPGGFHVMFLDLKRRLNQGDTVKGELVFEKAGKVAVEYRIDAMGASGADHGGHKH